MSVTAGKNKSLSKLLHGDVSSTTTISHTYNRETPTQTSIASDYV